VDTLTRLRHAQKRISKAQRRIWLLQVALWPTVVVAGIGAVAAFAVWFRGRHADRLTQPVDGLPHL
jgi:nitrate reductase NapE component